MEGFQIRKLPHDLEKIQSLFSFLSCAVMTQIGSYAYLLLLWHHNPSLAITRPQSSSNHPLRPSPQHQHHEVCFPRRGALPPLGGLNGCLRRWRRKPERRLAVVFIPNWFVTSTCSLGLAQGTPSSESTLAPRTAVL